MMWSKRATTTVTTKKEENNFEYFLKYIKLIFYEFLWFISLNVHINYHANL